MRSGKQIASRGKARTVSAMDFTALIAAILKCHVLVELKVDDFRHEHIDYPANDVLLNVGARPVGPAVDWKHMEQL